MANALDPHLVEVLKLVTTEWKTLKELEETRKVSQKLPTSWINRTVLPNLNVGKQTSREFERALRELVQFKLIERDVTRFLDEPLDRDTEIFRLKLKAVP